MATPAALRALRESQTKSRQRTITNDGKRYVLSNRATAIKSSRAQLTRAINRLDGLEGQARGGGQELKFSVEKMAERVNATSEQMAEIRAMRPEELQALYDSNSLLFDIFFNYAGLNDDGDRITSNDSKLDDVDFLIEQYNRAFS